ncbi:electron transfer flavoprotein subunit beta/FixA family protein [Clostridium formicaceticum]|uniref:Electron transfer flavoprotein small subunit n=1 Tax=Clostridium formicaceticum TaxID=1497 RepID=A0AAC9RIF9_9CLOT|nr:electron transfer flavoprotein subunit beta/FixA family protein [Clostridium formicaceticum]AOY75776.1 electron transfer flavoprotein, beta subunit [Clostridium formicaceticum]ARE86102.1 Acryloyl-CoA reductase electron transfer subunit gamma [Clostridium formicaceticum]
MNIVVLIKQVPDMDKVKFDSEKGTIDRKSAGTEINPFDLNALETAIQIKEKTDGKVTVLSMGPPSAEDALREAIARGADEGFLISDKYFGGADTKATSHTLAAGIKKIGDFHLIIAGEKTVDGDTGQVGAETAGYLNIPHVSYVSRIEEVGLENLQVVSEISSGSYLKEMRLPGLITVTKNINTPRLPAFKRKMMARKAEIKKLTLEDLQEFLSVEEVGLKGSPTWVNKIEIPSVSTREGKIFRDDIMKATDTLVELFKEIKVVEV